jgi:hypothetical protein
MILRLLCIWLAFLFIVVIADARNHEPEKLHLFGISTEWTLKIFGFIYFSSEIRCILEIS